MLTEWYWVLLLIGISSAIEFNCPDGAKKILFAHPNNCEKFVQCEDGVAEEVDCIPGLHYNPTLEYCDFPENVVCASVVDIEIEVEGSGEISGPKGECPYDNVGSLTLLPDSNDCTVFYKCDWGVPIQFVCPSGLHFNPTLGVCDHAWSAGCSSSF